MSPAASHFATGTPALPRFASRSVTIENFCEKVRGRLDLGVGLCFPDLPRHFCTTIKEKIGKIFNLCSRRRRGESPPGGGARDGGWRAPSAAAMVAQIEFFEILNLWLRKCWSEIGPNGARTDRFLAVFDRFLRQFLKYFIPYVLSEQVSVCYIIRGIHLFFIHSEASSAFWHKYQNWQQEMNFSSCVIL